MTKPVGALRLGDWTEQGLPCYAGSVVYQTKVEPETVEGGRLILAIPEYCGVAARVAIDGVAAGIIYQLVPCGLMVPPKLIVRR